MGFEFSMKDPVPTSSVHSCFQRTIDTHFVGFLLRLVRKIFGVIPKINPVYRSSDNTTLPKPSDLASIVFGVNDFHPEGAQLSALELLSTLSRHGSHKYAVVASTDGNLRTAFTQVANSIEILESPQASSLSGFAYEKSLLSFVALLRDLNPKLVVCNTLDCFHLIDAARQLAIPTVWIVREGRDPTGFFRHLPYAVQQRAMACLSYPTAFVFLNHHLLDSWGGSVRKFLIPTAPDKEKLENRVRGDKRLARESLGFGLESKVLLSVGTICENKGQDHLVRAFGLSAAATDYLVLVGRLEESFKRTFETMLDSLSAASRERILVVGSVGEVAQYFASADAFVNTSLHEGYPRSLLEALAAGLPILASNISGNKQVLESCKCLFHEFGDVAKLAADIETLGSKQLELMSSSSLQRWGEIADSREVIESYHAVFEAALAS